MHAWSRMAEKSSSFMLPTLFAPEFFCWHVRCQIPIQACHGIQVAVTGSRRTPMLPEAPVASREATALPGHLTCLPGRAAWGVWPPAPHVKDYLLGCWTIWNSHLGLHWSGPRTVLVPARAVSCPARHQQPSVRYPHNSM